MINRFYLILKWKRIRFKSRIRMLLLVLILWLHMHRIHLFVMIWHWNGMHHRGPFCDWLLNIMMLISSDMRIDMLFHTIAIVMIHHYWDWSDLHDWGAFFACFSHGYSLLSISFDAVWHLAVIDIAELILLWWDVSINTGCICAI